MSHHSLFDTQRAMRAQRQAALRRGIVAVLDIGSWKISCLVLSVDADRQDSLADGVGSLVGHGAFRIVGAATTRSRGVEFGEIASMEETERAIRTAIVSAQKMAGVRADHVIACLSGAAPRSYGLVGEVQLDGEVTEGDIGAVLAACEVPDYGNHREAIHALPVNFSIDHRTGLGDPRGQLGNTLSVDMHLLTVEADPVHTLLGCLQRCDLEVAGVASASYAAGMAALVEDEQELGAACIDLGAGATGISIFARRHLIYADAVALGGANVTRDISRGLQVCQTTAEALKVRHGGLFATSRCDRDMAEIGGQTGDWETDRRQVSKAEIIGIMRPRVEEILEEVRDRLDAAGFDCLPSQRVVLTGGAAETPGIEGLAQRILGRPVRLGRPMRVQGLPLANSSAAHSAVVGLALHAVHPQDECWDFKMPFDGRGAKRLRRALRWFRDNW